jgi:hypothetical protein
MIPKLPLFFVFKKIFSKNIFMPKKDEKGENAPCNDHTDENRKTYFLTCRGAKKE